MGYSPGGQKESDTTERLTHKQQRQKYGGISVPRAGTEPVPHPPCSGSVESTAGPPGKALKGIVSV